jgi:hypothetical protein
LAADIVNKKERYLPLSTFAETGTDGYNRHKFAERNNEKLNNEEKSTVESVAPTGGLRNGNRPPRVCFQFSADQK